MIVGDLNLPLINYGVNTAYLEKGKRKAVFMPFVIQLYFLVVLLEEIRS